MTRFTISALMTVAMLSLSACGGGKTTTNVSTTTTGQELTDLKAALDNGIITDAEYEKKRRALLKGK